MRIYHSYFINAIQDFQVLNISLQNKRKKHTYIKLVLGNYIQNLGHLSVIAAYKILVPPNRFRQTN